MEHLADCTLCRELVKSISPQIDFGVRAVAAAIREEWRHRPVVAAPRDVPFGPGSIDAHMDTSSGDMDMDTGHVDGADVKVTLEYATAKAIFVDGNPQAAMQAFMAGKVKVEGDMTKLMAMQQGTNDPSAAEIATKIADITE